MLDSIIRFSIRNKLIIGLFTLALVVWGGYSLSRLPIDALPDITNNQVQVITRSPALAAQEIERLVTFPIEQTMATIPNIVEIRSLSRFGLSVVTIVFTDKTDVYWARQQISERLTEARSQIPAGTGEPTIGPVSTGLGEIYQYVIYAKPGFENRYSPTELRSIQDWVVRRQLLGTPGVADVSSFGGLLKQYEIAIDPDRLRSYGLSIGDLFTALSRNNQNTGGAYIDKKPNAYFIRTEGLVTNLDDIGRIVVRRTTGRTPVLIRDVATVQFGSAVRYGALTRNGEGEAVGALVLMLKGENANTVIGQVKTRMEQIRRTLPEGVDVHAFLDRSELVGRAIGTVTKNLIEGALIVIFVLILFLGNLRAGLIVASVIPLAMLFAVSMMYLFGVSGNLMSLGAIDFGLIVDGAVIIVEASLHHLGLIKLSRLTQEQMDEEVYTSASRIRDSAAFGEIIILIVYLPILALVGIEGKMFGPMAQVVAFAIAGAFILSLTYVPMMSALFLSKNLSHKPNFSDRMMAFFQRGYEPALRGAMRMKTLVLALSVALLVGAVWLFTTLGGEFIPNLNEGDFAVEVRVRTGSSLSQTIDKVLQASALLKKQFPEVREVIGKTGAGEIPTDPMPIEATDLMVILKPQDQWTSATSKDELATKMAEALEVIPGVEFGFQQPIQMRFNELISGAKQDVAVKIFGEDLAELTRLAGQINGLVSKVSGATDVYVEQVSGLPQVVVQIDREALARYGLSVDEVNQTVSAAFAGQSAGLVYEGERRYDLTVRLAQSGRSSIEDVRALTIPVPDGPAVPLSQLASVDLRPGPNQIQREDAKRRLSVAFNVRGRDVESVVLELQQKINSQIKFPPGYYVTYGGQFENLIEARDRLSIAVPVSLALIFGLLFLTFGSARQSLLIFSAIPLAAIGGILALWLRDMPFSISAGVGFIALFGVAVLNGIVLIGEFNRLRLAGETDLVKVIYAGTAVRLRPVLMTATVASLGFLPMALSSSAGAEVQKPLATVVIGGLLTATLLTLFVLPVLYVLIERRFGKKFGQPKAISEPVAVSIANWLVIGLIGLGTFGSLTANAQVTAQPGVGQIGTGSGLSLAQALQQAGSNNPQLRVSQLNVGYQQSLRATAGDVGKTDISTTFGQYNSRYVDQSFTIGQRLPNPALVRGLRSLADARTAGAEAEGRLTRADLARQVKATYYQLWYVQSQAVFLRSQDSLFAAIARGAEVRRRTGEGTLLEQTAAEVQRRQAQTALSQNALDAQILARQLQTLLASFAPPTVPDVPLTERTLPIVDSSMLAQNPELALLGGQIEVARRETDVEAARLKPDFTVGLTNQSLQGFQTLPDGGGDRFYGFGNRFTYGQVGVSIPLFAKPLKARVAAARIGQQRAEAQRTARERSLKGEVATTIQSYQKDRQALTYYRESALPQAALIREQVTKSYRAGEIGYVELLQNLRTVSEIQTGYLAALNDLNQTLINLDFLLGRID
ncbi:CusA/CzcA family heavy metal efflux RND transporter [Fibrivirga algicola]|jgi:cobalt-zinc-cadmium resistance protein CzcA|uniref:CusA/CzcA family heavy metal efflux RND transporter n=1 Tax=Fibrivirga algicola TaxID=2950420 RepID=A0ABX0QM54_9BACT|nr:CusA/CzcA family heavy metal efflux RND transporter [Fibrivirga algicola]NID13570.1 CusA/CzcA family heavy metal efflux RND transporter [Fibrivirga algicola]